MRGPTWSVILLLINLIVTLQACDDVTEFQCADNNQCISKTDTCNTINDCDDGSDENNCACLEKLGMEDGTILDSSLIASSSKTGSSPSYARASNDKGNWCPKSDDSKPFFKVKFDTPRAISAIVFTLKQSVVDPLNYLSTWTLKAVLPGSDEEVTLYEGLNAFSNNSLYRSLFFPSLVTDTFIIAPTTWQNEPCLSFELYGCNIDNLCPTGCQNNGKCSGNDICACTDGYFGTKCQFQKTTIPFSSYIFKSLESGSLVTSSETFTVRTSTTIRTSKIIEIQGRKVLSLPVADYFTAPKDGKFGCLSKLGSGGCKSFYLALGCELEELKDTVQLFTTGSDSTYIGAEATLKSDNLVVTFRTSELIWTLNVRKTNMFSSSIKYVLEFDWDISTGIRIYVNKKLIGQQRQATRTTQVLRTNTLATSGVEFFKSKSVNVKLFSLKSSSVNRISLIKTSLISLTPTEECDQEKEHKCANSDKCIDKSTVCDSVEDCDDGSDEQNCPTTTCDVKVYKKLVTKSASLSLDLLEVDDAQRVAKCTELTTTIESSIKSMSECWDVKDSSVSSTNEITILRHTLRPHLQTFKKLKTKICDGEKITFESTEKCKVENVAKCFRSFYQHTIGSSSSITGTCSSTRSSFRCVTRTTEECPETLKSVISDLTNEMKTTITSFCSPASCNIEYSKLCLADPVLEQVTVQDGKLSKDSCKKLKQVLSCVTNHTVDCLPSEYFKVQSMVEEKRVLYSEKCPLIPEPECERSIKPSDSILAELALFNSGLIPSSVCSNQLKVDTTTLEDNSDSQLLTTYRNTKIEQFCKCKECDTVKAAQIIAEISAESDICSTLSRFEELAQVISGCNSDEDITAVTDLQGDFISSCTESLPTCQTKVCSPSNWETCLKDSRTCADILTCLTDELKDCEDVEKFRYFAEAKVRALELPCTLTGIFSVGSVEQGVFVCYESAHKEIMKFPPRNDQMVLYMCPTFDTFKSCVKKIDKIDAVTDLAVQRYLKVFERVESVACDSWKTGDTIQSGFSGNGKCDINGGKTCLDDVGDILVNLGPDDDLDQVCSAGILEKLRCAATSVSDSCIATEKSDFTLYDIAYGQMYTAYQSVCGQDKLPNLGLTTETFCGTERKASVCVAKFVNHVSTNAYSVHQQKSCSELNELKECLNSQLYCNEESSKKYHAILKWAVDITSLFCAPVTTDCDVDEIKTCVKDYLTGLYSSSDDIKICSELKKTKTCIEEKTAKCSDYLKQYGKRQLHQAVGLSPESCQKQLPCEICDPAGAINCILDVHHWSKFLYPNWQQICPALDKSAGCVKQHLESCGECEKDTVNGIVTKLNSRLKDTCQYPPQTKCKIQEARQCIEKLRYDWSEMSVDVDDELEDFMCLRISEARNCLYETIEHCEFETAIVLKTDLEKLVSKMDACDDENSLETCLNLFDENYDLIMNIKPLKTGISSNSKDKDSKDKDSKDKDSKDKDSKDSKDKNSKGKKSNGKKSRRRRAPGSKEKKNTGEKHTKEKHTNEKHTKEKDTKEKHTKEKHTNEKDTKEKHTKEKNTKEKHTKEKNTKEKNSKEKDYMNTDKLEVQCKRLVQSWKCIQFQIVSAKTPRNLAINLTIASFYQLALHKCQVLQNTELTCHSCTHQPDNEECNKEPSQTCSGNQMCQTVVETDDNGDKKWSKGCIDIDQCKPGRYYNKYTHCCRGDYCNAESVAPVHGGCNIEAAKVCSRRLVIGLLLTEDLNCSVLDEELSCMVDVRKECVETGHKWHLQTVDLLHKSSEAKQCRLKQLDTDCGVNSIRSLYQSLKNPDILVDDLCSLLDVVGKKVQAVRSDPRCSDKLKDINISYLVIWYRFNGVKCREVLPVCINDKKENCNANPVCDYIEIIQECFHTQKYEGLDTCQKVQKQYDCTQYFSKPCSRHVVLPGIVDLVFKSYVQQEDISSCSSLAITPELKMYDYTHVYSCLAKFLSTSAPTEHSLLNLGTRMNQLETCLMDIDISTINAETTITKMTYIGVQEVMLYLMSSFKTKTETVCGTCDDVAAAKCFSDGLAMFESPDVSDVNTICSQTLETTMKCVYQAIARCEDKTAFEASLNKFIADYDNICTIPADISSYTIPCSIPSGSVSDKCKAGRKRVDACFTTQISAILAKQFIGYREMRSYCSYGRKFEECYDNELTDCNEDEVSDIAMSREIIQNYVKIECGDDLTVKPQCEPEMAKQCVDTLITDLGDGSGSGHKCRSLERTIKCYETYTFNCKSDDITAIKYRLERVIHSHRYTCKQLLQPWSCSTSGDESDSGTDGMETGGDAKGDGTSGNTVDLTVCDKTSALACFSSFTLTSLPSCSDFKSMMNCAVRSVIGCEDNVVIETVDSLNNNFLNAASLTSSCIAKTSVEKLNAQFKLIKDKATTSNEKVCSAEEALKCFDFLKPDTNIPCPTFKEMKRCSMLNIEKCTSDVRDTAITSINSAISAFLTASTTFVPSCIQTVTKDNLLSIGMVPKPSFSLTLDKCIDFSIKPSNIIQCVLLKYQNKETIDCDLTGLSTFEQEFVNIFKKETAVATVTSTTLTSISTSFEAIIVKPTGYLWHVCSLAKTLTTTLKGYADDASDDVGLTRSMTSLDVFLINTCGNTDLINIPPVIIPETEKDECNKAKINRIITPALLKYLFSSYLTSGDICSDASMVKIMVKDELTECSDEYKEHILVVLQLLTTLAKPACFTSPKCNVQKAYSCLSQLNAEIALFGIENTPRDICRALSTNDVCMEHYLGDCHPDRLHLIRYVSNKDRLVAFTICSGEQVQVQPVCQSQYIGRTEGELKCSKLDSGCSNSLFKDFYLPDDGALCSASARLGQCQVGFEPKCFNSLPSTYLTSSKTYFSSECDSSKYIVPCSADCDPRKIRGCFDTFFNSVDPFWNLMDSEGKCREVQKARQCVRMATKKCDKQSRDKAIYKLSRLGIAYGVENCPDGYDCMTEFTMLAKKIFIASEIITKPDKDSSSKSTDSDDTSESSDSEDKEATKESKDKKSNGKKSRRKRAPGAKDKKNTKEKNTKEKNTKEKSTKEKNTKEKNTKEKSTKEKNTKEKNTKEKNTKEKNTKEKNTKEKNTKEKNTKEKNTKEKNTKEKATKENTKEKNTKEKNTQEKNTKEHNTKETKEKNTQEKHSMEKPDIDLSALCHKAKMLWKCIEGSYGTISINYNDQIAYLSLYGIWSSVKERCSKTVKQSCYRCYGEADEKECFKKTEVCSHHSQMCQSFAGVSTKTGVFEHSKGCVRPSQCKRGCNSMGCTDCCIGDLCNEKLQVTGVVDTKVCDVSKSVDCSLMLLKNMHDDGGCTESYQKLECMIEYSKDCLSDSRKEISRSASKIVKVLARNSCPPPISQQCNSAAILAFQTALSNPYVAGKDAICKQRLDALAALTSLSASSTCSPIDIVVYQQVMTDSERLIRDFCLSGTEQCMVPLTVDITIDIEVSVSHVKKSQCARELANFGICLANGMMKLKTGFDDASCGEVSQKKCMSKELKSCNVPKGLNDLGSELATFKASGCTVDDPAPKDCSIATLTKCDIAESYNCLHDLDKTKTNFCQDLTASRSCVQSSTSGCLSIQELSTIDLYNTYRKESKTVCLAAQVPGTLEVKVDVFTGYSTCLEIFGEALGTAFESDDFEAKICKALDESDTCIDQVPMPELTKPLVTATVNKYRDGMSTFMRTCSSETPGGDIGDGVDRVKRDTSGDKCDIKQAGFCLSKLSMISQTLPVIHYSDHLTFCRSMQEYETCVKDNIKECTNKKKTGLMVTILESLISSSEQYCVLQVLEEPSCNIEYAEECIETFTVLTSYSSYTHEQICRNAEVTLKCVKKFTTECSDTDQSTRVRGKITTIVQSVVGNDCPSVTALLFCDGADIDATCNAEEAKSCFTTLKKKLLDVSSRLADKEEYCRVVTKNWKCLRQSVQGCTETVFNQLTADVDAEFLVRVKASGCDGVDSDPIPQTCIAEPTCSIDSLYTCIDDFTTKAKDDKASACSSVDSHITCITSQSGCTEPQKLVVLTELTTVSNALCGTAVSIAQTVPELVCLQTFVQDLASEILNPSKPGVRGMCDLFTSYSSCFGAASFDELGDVISNFYGVSGDILSKFVDAQALCKNDPTDSKVVKIDLIKGVSTASCVVRQLSSVLVRRLLPLTEKEMICSKTSYVESCISEKTSGLTTDESAFFTKVTTLTDSLTTNIEFCQEPQLCLLKEVTVCVQDLQTEIATFETSGERSQVCRKIRETEDCVKHFGYNCGNDGTTLMKTFKAAEKRVETICADVLPPICDNVMLPSCDIVDALECVTKFNVDLISHQSVVWRDMCTELQTTVQCVAHSTSSCDPDDIKDVVANMVDLKNGIGRRCPWLMDDVCGKPCTTQSASCIADFKYQLLSGTDTDICGLIKLAKECIISKSSTCGAKQKQAGLDRLDKAIEGLNIPVNCEDGNAVQKCLISNRQAVLSELSQRASDSDGDAVCSSITSMNECIENEKDGDEVPEAIRDILDAVFPLKLDCSANLDGSCAFKDIKSATQRLLDFLIAVASDQTSDFEKDVYCSKLKVLEDYVSGLDGECNDRGLGKVLNGMQSFCEPDNGCDDLETTLDACVSLYTQVKNDEDKSCIGIQLARICLSSAVTGCTGSTVTTLLNTRLQLLLTDPLCPPIPQFKLATSTKKTIYLLEGGPSFPLSVSLLESPGDNAILKLTVKASNMASSPPKCRSEDDEGFQQIHVTNPNSLEFTKDNFNKAITFDLSAVLDGRVDGSQTMMVQIVADLVVNSNIKYSDLIAEYTVLVVDRDDKTAICSTINDPHVKTFDKLLYDNQLQGKFVLYKHQTLPYMVQVTYQKCAEEGTCNCRVQILSGDDVIDFNRCYTETDDRDVSKPLELSITRTGEFTPNTQIYSQDEGRRFYVLLPTGTLVQIRLGDFYMNVWITPSVVDKDHTEGLCGVYNGDTYDDLRLPNGDKYTVIDADKTGGVLTVNDFSKEWRVIIDSDNDLSVTSTAYYSDVTSTKQYTVEACGLIQGIDITSDLVSESEEYATDGRKKRAVANDNIDIDESAKPSVSEWPTKTGWTLNNATKFCQDNILSWGVTQKCLEAISAIGGKTNFETEVNNCVADIKLSGNTNWVDSAKDDVLQNCLNELNKDVQYLNNPEAKLQAEAVMSSSCNPSDCNGNGQCTTGTCICKKDYYGSDCSMKEDELPTPVLYSIKNNGECILSDKSSCTNVFISGRQFIQSEKLTCHIQPLEVTETGHKAVGQPTIVIAKLLTLNQISCKVSGIKTPTTSLHISISNNGKSTSNKLMYIAYNVAIHQCNALEGTCKLQSNLCKIGGQVYNKDESLPTDKCLYCNPEESQTRWSSKSEAGCEIIAERRDDNPSGLGLTETIIIGVFGGLAFFIIVAILIKFVLVKRNRRTPKRVDDTEVALPPSPKSPQERELQIFQNEVYVSSDDLKDENDSMPELNDSRSIDDRSASERCSTRIKPRINTQSMSGPFVTKIDIN